MNIFNDIIEVHPIDKLFHFIIGLIIFLILRKKKVNLSKIALITLLIAVSKEIIDLIWLYNHNVSFDFFETFCDIFATMYVIIFYSLLNSLKTVDT